MKISGFEDIICIDEFCCRQWIDEHEECRFSILVTGKNVSACTDQLEKTCTVEDGDFRFSGTVTGVTVIPGADWCRVEAVVLGSTLRFDQDKRCRVFQDEKKTVSDVLRKMGLSDISCSVKQELPAILVQDHETDWHFLRRLAAYTGKRLFPGEKTWFGDPLKESRQLEESDILELRVNLDLRQSSAVCRTREPLKLGVRTQLYGKDFYVDGVTYRKNREEYFYEYHLLEPEKDFAPAGLPLHILPAKVTDNEDPEKRGRVKLGFLEPYEDVLGDAWIPCGSMWASKELGIACVPWKDDLVDVHILDGNAVVAQSRRDNAFDSRFKGPDARYLFAGKNTWLMMDDEQITVDNSTYTCTISGDQFSLRFGKKLSIMIEDGKLTAHMDKTDLEMTDATKLITQELQIDGKKSVEMTASKVEIKGSNGVSIN